MAKFKKTADSGFVCFRLVSEFDLVRSELSNYLSDKNLGKQALFVFKGAKQILDLGALCIDCMKNHRNAIDMISAVDSKLGVSAAELYAALTRYSRNPKQNIIRSIIHAREAIQRVIEKKYVPDESVKSALDLFEGARESVLKKYA